MDVCIVGAGWSGIYACKYALENGLTPIVLERRSDLGGVWNYSEDPQTTTVMKSTVSSSSRIVTEASDFFMDESVGHFMHHEDILDYLRSYVSEFDLGQYLQFSAEVISMEKSDDQWTVTYSQHGETKSVRVANVAVCAGLHNKQRAISQPVSDFAGTVTHSGDIKNIQPEDYTADDHVIVYGGGETASDIIDLLVKTPAKVTWAIRGGQHFLRKTPWHQRKGVGQFDNHDYALDLLASPLIYGLSSFAKNAPGRRYIADWLSTGSVTKYQGHGTPVWKNEHRYAQQFFNKNGHSVEHIYNDRVTPQNEVVSVDGHEVEFKSGSRETFSHIICCFGYEFHCPFLPEAYRNGKLDDLYQFVFPVEDTSVAFLGFARPIIGSIPVITEMQCNWVFRAWSDKISLPTQKRMVKRQGEINKKWERRLPGRGQVKTLVLPSTYASAMIKEASPGRSPAEHFKKKPLRALKFLSWIPSGSMRTALDPDISDEEFNELWRKRSHGFFIAYVLPMIVAVGRLLHVEMFIDWYVERKDRRHQQPQMSQIDLNSEDLHPSKSSPSQNRHKQEKQAA